MKNCDNFNKIKNANADTNVNYLDNLYSKLTFQNPNGLEASKKKEILTEILTFFHSEWSEIYADILDPIGIDSETVPELTEENCKKLCRGVDLVFKEDGGYFKITNPVSSLPLVKLLDKSYKFLNDDDRELTDLLESMDASRYEDTLTADRWYRYDDFVRVVFRTPKATKMKSLEEFYRTILKDIPISQRPLFKAIDPDCNEYHNHNYFIQSLNDAKIMRYLLKGLPISGYMDSTPKVGTSALEVVGEINDFVSSQASVRSTKSAFKKYESSQEFLYNLCQKFFIGSNYMFDRSKYDITPSMMVNAKLSIYLRSEERLRLSKMLGRDLPNHAFLCTIILEKDSIHFDKSTDSTLDIEKIFDFLQELDGSNLSVEIFMTPDPYGTYF